MATTLPFAQIRHIRANSRSASLSVSASFANTADGLMVGRADDFTVVYLLLDILARPTPESENGPLAFIDICYNSKHAPTLRKSE